MKRHVALAVLLVACAKHTEPPDRSGTPRVVVSDAAIATVADAATDAPPAKDVAACTRLNGQILFAIKSSYVAMDGQPGQRKAATLWPTVPESCRDGRWYLAAALMLDYTKGPLVAGTVSVENPEAAFGAALAQPDEVDVLARVALVASLGGKPSLPANACTRAGAANAAGSAADDVAYVCAHAAIGAGDGVAATKQLAAIASPKRFIDIELLRARAAKLSGDAKQAKAHAKLAAHLDELLVRDAMLSPAMQTAIVDAAKQILASK